MLGQPNTAALETALLLLVDFWAQFKALVIIYTAFHSLGVDYLGDYPPHPL